MFCKAVFFSLHLRQHWILLELFWFSLQIIYTVKFVFHFCRVLLLYRQNKMQSFRNQYVSYVYMLLDFAELTCELKVSGIIENM